MSRHILRRWMLLVTAGLILAGSAAADEFYVPLSSGSDARFVTEVRIVNRSENSVTVAIETLAPFGWAGKSSRLTVGTGETIERSDIVAGHAGSDRFDALAIRTDGPLLVTATRRCADCGAMSKYPVLAAQNAIQDGAITVGTTIDAWKSGVGVINPGAAGALLTVSLHRDVIDEASVYVPGRAARVVSIDDLFSVSATDPNDRVSFSASQSVLLYRYASNERSGAKFFTPVAPTATTPLRRRAVRSGPPTPMLQTVVLAPSKDNTLYQTSNGSLSNGAGIHLFAGMTNRRERRRALLAFDVASQIPPGS